jgi:hypothetical protein
MEVRECLLSIGEESVVFHVVVQKIKDQDVYRSITISAILYGCETWSLTRRVESMQRVFK